MTSASDKRQGVKEEALLTKLQKRLVALNETVDELESFLRASGIDRQKKTEPAAQDESKSARFVRAFVKQGEEQRATTLNVRHGEKSVKKSLSLEDRFCLAVYQRGPLTREQLGYYTGISNTSASSNKALRRLEKHGTFLREAGRFVFDGNDISLNGFYEQPMPRASEVLDAFCEREGSHLEGIVRAILRLSTSPERAKETWGKPLDRDMVCVEAGVSKTSASSMSAFRRLSSLGILESNSKTLVVSPWFLQANEPVVKVRDWGTGSEQLVNARTGMP